MELRKIKITDQSLIEILDRYLSGHNGYLCGYELPTLLSYSDDQGFRAREGSSDYLSKNPVHVYFMQEKDIEEFDKSCRKNWFENSDARKEYVIATLEESEFKVVFKKTILELQQYFDESFLNIGQGAIVQEDDGYVVVCSDEFIDSCRDDAVMKYCGDVNTVSFGHFKTIAFLLAKYSRIKFENPIQLLQIFVKLFANDKNIEVNEQKIDSSVLLSSYCRRFIEKWDCSNDSFHSVDDKANVLLSKMFLESIESLKSRNNDPDTKRLKQILAMTDCLDEFVNDKTFVDETNTLLDDIMNDSDNILDHSPFFGIFAQYKKTSSLRDYLLLMKNAKENNETDLFALMKDFLWKEYPFSFGYDVKGKERNRLQEFQVLMKALKKNDDNDWQKDCLEFFLSIDERTVYEYSPTLSEWFTAIDDDIFDPDIPAFLLMKLISEKTRGERNLSK